MSSRSAFPCMGEPGRNRAWALGISLFVHLLVVCTLIPWRGSVGLRSDALSSGGATSFTVAFVEVPAHSEDTPAVEPAPTDRGASDVQPKNNPSKTEGDLQAVSPLSSSGQLAGAAVQTALGEAASHPTVATPGANLLSAGGSSDDLAARYIAAIREAVMRQWSKTKSRASGIPCTLELKQAPGGQVISALSEPCGLDADGRHALEAAALMVQPLPYVGFESVFQTDMKIDFRSE